MVSIFWPSSGLLDRWRSSSRLSDRVLTEDALKHVFNFTLDKRRPTIESIAGALHISTNHATKIISALEEKELVQLNQGVLSLTPAGDEYALRIIRAHRLWERYLADKTGFTEEEWHAQAEKIEHKLSQTEIDAIASGLGNPSFDPHGDPIPTDSGLIHRIDAVPLSTVSEKQRVRIVHIEDEPEIIYKQLLAEGIHVGMEVSITAVNPERITFWSETNEHVLAPLIANNLSVIPVEELEEDHIKGVPLSTLPMGNTGKILSIGPGVRGPDRRRLMDLGLLPGTLIGNELVGPGGDPIAYRVRGALIALRESQAQAIKIELSEQHNE